MVEPVEIVTAAFGFVALLVNGWAMIEAGIDAYAVRSRGENGGRRLTADSWVIGAFQRFFGSIIAFGIGMVQLGTPTPNPITDTYWTYRIINCSDSIVLALVGIYLGWSRLKQLGYLSDRTRTHYDSNLPT